jgi:hypothetical protein
MESRSDTPHRPDINPEPRASGIGPAGCEWEDGEDVLREFRRCARLAAERPESFWDDQRAAVSTRLTHSVRSQWRRQALLWVPAAAAVVLCLFLFVKDGSAPTPDFAGGADQDLLVGVERARDQEFPSALEPAALLTEEMEQTVKIPGP